MGRPAGTGRLLAPVSARNPAVGAFAVEIEQELRRDGNNAPKEARYSSAHRSAGLAGTGHPLAPVSGRNPALGAFAVEIEQELRRDGINPAERGPLFVGPPLRRARRRSLPPFFHQV